MDRQNLHHTQSRQNLSMNLGTTQEIWAISRGHPRFRNRQPIPQGTTGHTPPSHPFRTNHSRSPYHNVHAELSALQLNDLPPAFTHSVTPRCLLRPPPILARCAGRRASLLAAPSHRGPTSLLFAPALPTKVPGRAITRACRGAQSGLKTLMGERGDRDARRAGGCFEAMAGVSTPEKPSVGGARARTSISEARISCRACQHRRATGERKCGEAAATCNGHTAHRPPVSRDTLGILPLCYVRLPPPTQRA